MKKINGLPKNKIDAFLRVERMINILSKLNRDELHDMANFMGLESPPNPTKQKYIDRILIRMTG